MVKSFLDEIRKFANINTDGKSEKNINSNTKPAKVPIVKGTTSKQAPNPIKTLKPPKARMPKMSFFKGADNPSKKPAPKPEVVTNNVEQIRDIMKRYPPAPSGPNVTDEQRMDFLLDQTWHKRDFKTILEAQNQHQVLQVNEAQLNSMPGDSISYRQFFNFKPGAKLQSQPKEVK